MLRPLTNLLFTCNKFKFAKMLNTYYNFIKQIIHYLISTSMRIKNEIYCL